MLSILVRTIGRGGDDPWLAMGSSVNEDLWSGLLLDVRACADMLKLVRETFESREGTYGCFEECAWVWIGVCVLVWGCWCRDDSSGVDKLPDKLVCADVGIIWERLSTLPLRDMDGDWSVLPICECMESNSSM